MQYLVQMKLVPQGRPTTSEEGTAFIEHYIFPTLERCKKLQDEKKILAGGPMSIVGSYLTQVHLQHELESNNYGVFLSDNDLYMKVKRMVYPSSRSDFKTRRNIAQHRDCAERWFGRHFGA